MKKLYILFTLLVALELSANVLLSPVDAMLENYGSQALISKKNILLSNSRFIKIQKSASAKLDTKIYRIFTAKKNGKILGYGILINRKVRSKNAVALYLISKNTLKSIEIIAFNEPVEYIPSQKWSAQFNKTSTHKMLQLNRDIPSISGATMSARSITDGSRIAFAIYNELLRDR